MLFTICFINCSSLKTNTKQEETNNSLKITNEFYSSFRSNPDSIHVFECNGKKYALRAKKISRPYFPYELRDCLLDLGFKGDIEANKQLAKIIKNIRFNDLLIFGGSDAVYRGSEIFKTFLNKSQDYTPLNTFDDGEDSKYYEGTVADVYIGYYCKMIESIDGLAPYDYIGKMVNFQQTDNFEYKENGLFNPDYGVEVGTKTYNTILKAWKEGKIILKDYGIE